MSQVNLFRIQKGREKDFSAFIDARYKTTASSAGQGIRSEECSPKDVAPIGIILAFENDEMVVKFATQGITNKIFGGSTWTL